MKGAMVEVATEVCRVSKKRGVRRMKWWNEEVHKAIAVKEVVYRMMLRRSVTR